MRKVQQHFHVQRYETSNVFTRRIRRMIKIKRRPGQGFISTRLFAAGNDSSGRWFIRPLAHPAAGTSVRWFIRPLAHPVAGSFDRWHIRIHNYFPTPGLFY